MSISIFILIYISIYILIYISIYIYLFICHWWWWIWEIFVTHIQESLRLRLKISAIMLFFRFGNYHWVEDMRKFVYKLFEKIDTFPFSFVQMSHLENNIPQNIFYSIRFGEFLKISRSTFCLDNFMIKRKNLLKLANAVL